LKKSLKLPLKVFQFEYSPVTWCAERLQPGIRVISPEEMVWRIRMHHDPMRTKGRVR
jgi:hypothetical protein